MQHLLQLQLHFPCLVCKIAAKAAKLKQKQQIAAFAAKNLQQMLWLIRQKTCSKPNKGNEVAAAANAACNSISLQPNNLFYKDLFESMK